MPLPTIDLDTRRYPDLVDEARSLIPRTSPAWTDENASDPGITLLELFAFFTEQLVYRANRIPERHRRKFLALAGFDPLPPQPARAVLSFAPGAGGDGLLLPAGLALATGSTTFRTLAPLTLTATALVSAQAFDGQAFSDLTPALLAGLPLSPFGVDPSPPLDEPALYLGFDAAVPAGRTLSLQVAVSGARTGPGERARIEAEAAAAASCLPRIRSCDPPGAAPEPPAAPLVHHSVVVAWEVYDGASWRTLDPSNGEVVDETRGFTLDGGVALQPPVPVAAVAMGLRPEARFGVRCRLVAGAPDVAPALLRISANAVPAVQCRAVRSTFPILPGTPPPAVAPAPGTVSTCAIALDGSGAISSFEAPGADPPEAIVLDYLPATAGAPGSITVALAVVGAGSGDPAQSFVLPEAPVAAGELGLWTLEPAGITRWRLDGDFDAAGRHDAVFTLDAGSGIVTFGDGRNGRVLRAGATVVVRYDATLAAAGNVPAGSSWKLAGADDDLDTALLGGNPGTTQALLAGIAAGAPAAGGAAAETVAHAAGRAAAELWSHERLVNLAEDAGVDTLDQLDRASVLARVAPPRAATLLDFERLALEAAGTRVGRARAFGGIDGRYPGLSAPGTVTVVVVAGLPSSRPVPSTALLDLLAGYLGRRKTLGTRLVVVGPTYIEIGVRAALQLFTGADPASVGAAATARLAGYLDPISGGPAGRGWPFGRDVYRSEILQLLDGDRRRRSRRLARPAAGRTARAVGTSASRATGLPVDGRRSRSRRRRELEPGAVEPRALRARPASARRRPLNRRRQRAPSSGAAMSRPLIARGASRTASRFAAGSRASVSRPGVAYDAYGRSLVSRLR